MGFDVHGMNPKQNTKKPPLVKKIDEGDWLEAFENLSKEERDEYFTLKSKWESENAGSYFRNNVWWWRPLWDYVQDRLQWNADEGHYNDGFEVSEERALKIATTIKQDSDTGYLKTYEITHNRSQEGEKFSYPFNSDNALEFANFCEQSGGFRIC